MAKNEMAKSQPFEISKSLRSVAQTLDMACASVDMAALAKMSRFEKSFCLGKTIQNIREMLISNEEAMGMLMSLKNVKLGFKTDESTRDVKYNEEVVRDAIIEASLIGLDIVGNQFNILFGQMYVTLEGFEHLVRRIPEIKNLKISSMDVPRLAPGGAVVKMRATWEMQNGKKFEQRSSESEWAVGLTKNQGADAALSKGRRRVLREIYRDTLFELYGYEIDVKDGDIEDVRPVSARVIEDDPETPVKPAPTLDDIKNARAKNTPPEPKPIKRKPGRPPKTKVSKEVEEIAETEKKMASAKKEPSDEDIEKAIQEAQSEDSEDEIVEETEEVEEEIEEDIQEDDPESGENDVEEESPENAPEEDAEEEVEEDGEQEEENEESELEEDEEEPEEGESSERWDRMNDILEDLQDKNKLKDQKLVRSYCVEIFGFLSEEEKKKIAEKCNLKKVEKMEANIKSVWNIKLLNDFMISSIEVIQESES